MLIASNNLLANTSDRPNKLETREEERLSKTCLIYTQMLGSLKNTAWKSLSKDHYRNSAISYFLSSAVWDAKVKTLRSNEIKEIGEILGRLDKQQLKDLDTYCTSIAFEDYVEMTPKNQTSIEKKASQLLWDDENKSTPN